MCQYGSDCEGVFVCLDWHLGVDSRPCKKRSLLHQMIKLSKCADCMAARPPSLYMTRSNKTAPPPPRLCDGRAPAISRHSTQHKRWLNDGFILVQRRRRWTNVKPSLGQCFFRAGTVLYTHQIERICLILGQGGASVANTGPKLGQHSVNV